VTTRLHVRLSVSERAYKGEETKDSDEEELEAVGGETTAEGEGWG